MSAAPPRRRRHRVLKVVLALVTAYVLGDALRARKRLGALATLAPTDVEPSDRHRLVTAAGVHVGDATRRSATAFLVDNDLRAVDLVPGDLATEEALELAALVDPVTYRRSRLAPGRGAGRALLVDADLLERADIPATEGLDPVAFLAAEVELKRLAPTGVDLAVAPALTTHPLDPDQRKAYITALFSTASPAVFVMPAVQWVAIATGLVLAPPWGLAALAAYCAAPAVGVAGTPVVPSDLGSRVALRWLLEPVRWVKTLTGRWRPPPKPDPIESRREWYEQQLGLGLERLFEERRPDCPICGSTHLHERLHTTDILQHKPGEFILEECGDCGVIFQNPRLSVEGLDFYYEDFYDGLGEDFTEFIFGATDHSYVGRAEMVRGHTVPERWLDVGAGHGHFCLVARDTWPDTTFDGLDLSDSIDEAARRGWVDHGYRGMFPDVAASMAGAYDVVSMHHYLEHTREPLDELDAAATALVPGGHLLIELPDPESQFPRLVGRWWIPWFQPQHQHLIPLGRLKEELDRHGFDVVAEDRATAHQTVDFVIAAWLWLNHFVPADSPWTPKGSPLRGLARIAVVAAGAPLLVAAFLGDQIANVFIQRSNRGNTYRVLARRR